MNDKIFSRIVFWFPECVILIIIKLFILRRHVVLKIDFICKFIFYIIYFDNFEAKSSVLKNCTFR